MPRAPNKKDIRKDVLFFFAAQAKDLNDLNATVWGTVLAAVCRSGIILPVFQKENREVL